MRGQVKIFDGVSRGIGFGVLENSGKVKGEDLKRNEKVVYREGAKDARESPALVLNRKDLCLPRDPCALAVHDSRFTLVRWQT